MHSTAPISIHHAHYHLSEFHQEHYFHHHHNVLIMISIRCDDDENNAIDGIQINDSEHDG
jgi:hypothetical protein